MYSGKGEYAMKLDYTKIGQRIRTIRKKKGLSQKELAEKCNLSANHISHIERANTMVSLPSLVQIVNALEITTDDVLCDSIPKSVLPYSNEITELERNCNEKEIRIFSAVLKALKDAYRDSLSIY